MSNPFEEILKKIDEIQINKIRFVKLTKWCKHTGFSQTFALDCFKEAIYRPKGRAYMIDVEKANELIQVDKVA